MFFPIRLVSGFVDDLCSLRTTANQTRDPRLDWSSDSARVVRRRRHLPVPFSLVCTYSAPSLYEVSHLEKGSFPAVKRRPLFSLLPVRVLKRSLYSSPPIFPFPLSLPLSTSFASCTTTQSGTPKRVLETHDSCRTHVSSSPKRQHQNRDIEWFKLTSLG